MGSLFTGLGGLDIGLERAGFTVAWQSEIDPYCCSLLDEHWPGVPNLGDVKAIDWKDVPRVDVIAGGYPCQPWSQAGLMRGADDERHLWPFMRDALRELRPRWALLENVERHLGLGLPDVLADLAALGFDAEWSVVSACALGAPHRRRRLFVLAYAPCPDASGEVPPHPFDQERGAEPRGGRSGTCGEEWGLPEPDVDRMADGVPRWVVRGSLHGLGNSVAPPVAELVGHRLMAMIRGQEAPPCPSCGQRCVDATGDWQCHRCQMLWPASYFTEREDGIDEHRAVTALTGRSAS